MPTTPDDPSTPQDPFFYPANRFRGSYTERETGEELGRELSLETAEGNKMVICKCDGTLLAVRQCLTVNSNATKFKRQAATARHCAEIGASRIDALLGVTDAK